jgi:hypothetical protein
MAIDGSTAEGMFKEVYGQFENSVPEFARISTDIPYKMIAKTGKQYVFPVRFRRGHGVTFESGANSLTAFDLNAVKSGQTDDAIVSGSMFVGRESFAYKVVAQATGDNKYAFSDLFLEGVKDMTDTANFYKEALMLYGQTSFGQFDEAGPNATTATLSLTAASSAPGLLAQLEGGYIDVYSDTAFGTKRNATNPILVTGTTYDPDSGVCELILSGTATDIDAIAVGDVFVPRGFYSSGHKTMAGLDAILTTVSGSIFQISTTTYPAWAGTVYSAGSNALTFAKLIKACVAITVRCGMTEDVVKAYVSPATWTDLNNNHAALRRFTSDTKAEVALGTRSIRYYSVTGSEIEIVPHAMVKQGECFVGIIRYATRGGVTDTTFDLNKDTGQNPRFLLELADKAGFEIRCMWDLFIILTKPKAWLKISDIVNSF